MRTPITPEDTEQQLLIAWAMWQSPRHPELQLLHHIPNEGKRTPSEGGRQKRMGLRAGVPDLCLPIPRKGYHGLYIEMKVGRNKPTGQQQWWLDQLQAQGYLTAVCYSCEEAARELMRYIANTDETGLYLPGTAKGKGLSNEN